MLDPAESLDHKVHRLPDPGVPGGGPVQGSREAGVISHSQNEDFSTFQISKLSGLQFTSLNLRISHKYGFRVVTQSQIQFGTDSENSIFALFWLDGPSN